MVACSLGCLTALLFLFFSFLFFSFLSFPSFHARISLFLGVSGVCFRLVSRALKLPFPLSLNPSSPLSLSFPLRHLSYVSLFRPSPVVMPLVLRWRRWIRSGEGHEPDSRSIILFRVSPLRSHRSKDLGVRSGSIRS